MKFLSNEWLFKNRYWVSPESGRICQLSDVYPNDPDEVDKLFIPIKMHKSNGYLLAEIKDDNGKTHFVYAHKIVWSYFHKAPIQKDQQIDHVNRYRDDNRAINLALVSCQENQARKRVRGVGKLPESEYSLCIRYGLDTRTLYEFLCLVDFAELKSGYCFFSKKKLNQKEISRFWD